MLRPHTYVNLVGLGQWGPGAPDAGSAAGKSTPYCIRYLQTLLSSRGVFGLEVVTGTWNDTTLQYLEATFPSWRTFPGGACGIAAVLLSRGASSTPPYTGGTTGPNKAGVFNATTLGIVGVAAVLATIIIVTATRK